MATVNVQLTFQQLLAAIRQLPYKQKLALWRLLDAEMKGDDEILREFDQALETIRAANRGVTEDEVMADVERALREVRAAPPTALGS
jgi:hypothetical protein